MSLHSLILSTDLHGAGFFKNTKNVFHDRSFIIFPKKFCVGELVMYHEWGFFSLFFRSVVLVCWGLLCELVVVFLPCFSFLLGFGFFVCLLVFVWVFFLCLLHGVGGGCWLGVGYFHLVVFRNGGKCQYFLLKF